MIALSFHARSVHPAEAILAHAAAVAVHRYSFRALASVATTEKRKKHNHYHE
jgi:hypothetical protein